MNDHRFLSGELTDAWCGAYGRVRNDGVELVEFSGTSEWAATGRFNLTGQLNADGTVFFTDAPGAMDGCGFRPVPIRCPAKRATVVSGGRRRSVDELAAGADQNIGIALIAEAVYRPFHVGDRSARAARRSMAPIPRGGTVAVTGSAGFIGGWVVRLLLDEGYRVRACVRDPDDAGKTTFLKTMLGYASRRLTLHAADLDEPGCFDDIFEGCHGVAHLSHVSDYQDHDYVKMVCDHIITSVERSETVSRVVVTSSIAAVMEEVDIYELKKRPVLYEDRYPDEHNPKRTATRVGYSMGKVIAERIFSDAAEKSGGWDAITCCPGDNVGPILSAHQKDRGPWQHNIEMMLLGRYDQTQAYRPWMTVDVRDTAECHMRLLESVAVRNGERYIAWSTDMVDVEDICAGIDRLLPELGHDTPEPTEVHPERIQAREAELRAIWAGVEPRNDRMRAVTGVEFRSFDESLRDCVESLLMVAQVTPKLRPGFSLRTSSPAEA